MGLTEQALDIQDVFETIAGLSEDFRLTLGAVDVLGLFYRQAAGALGVREATITTRLFRARKRVAEHLGPQSPTGVRSGWRSRRARTRLPDCRCVKATTCASCSPSSSRARSTQMPSALAVPVR
jgi:predicted DNA-binding protein (UPF0251 family)